MRLTSGLLKQSRSLLPIGITILMLSAAGYAIWLNGTISGISKSLANFSAVGVSGVTLLLLIGGVLAAVRLKFVTSHMGYTLTFRDAVAASSVGQVAGSVFFQLAGQLIGRATFLKRRDISADATVVLTGYERLLGLFSALGLASAGAVYLFGGISFDTAGAGAALVKLAAGLALSLLLGAVLSWWPSFRAFLPSRITARGVLYVAEALFLSLVIQLATLAAYVTAAVMLAPELPVGSIIAASTIVMLAASLPISLGGWGVREMSAVVALGAVGMAPAGAVAVGVLIGAMSLIVAIVMALATAGEWVGRSVRATADLPRAGYTAALNLAVPLAAATAVFFQVFVPVREGLLNVNLADPVVILGAALVAVRGRLWIWDKALTVALAVFSLVVVFAWLNGLASFGWTDWAATKMFGWFVVICYAVTGASIASTEEGRRLLLATFIATAVAVCMVDIALLATAEMGVRWPQEVMSLPLSGFSQNRNAYSLILLTALCALAVVRIPWKAACGAILLATIFLSGSRAAYGATVLVAVAIPLIVPRAWWTMLRIVAGAAAIILALHLAGPLALSIVSSNFEVSYAVSAKSPSLAAALFQDQSNLERWGTIEAGIDLLLKSPIFGAGLGAYAKQTLAEGRLKVIHSTPIWLLAELGLLGFLTAAAAIALMMRKALRHMSDHGSKLTILMLVAFAPMALVHEMLYQRAWWLVLGSALAVQRLAERSSTMAPPRPAAS